MEASTVPGGGRAGFGADAFEVRAQAGVGLRLRLEPMAGGLRAVLDTGPGGGGRPLAAGARTSAPAAELAERLAHLEHRLSRAAGEGVAVRLDATLEGGERDLADALEELGSRASSWLAERRLGTALSRSATAAELLAPDPALRAEVAAYLATPIETLRGADAALARRIGAERFGGRVRLYAPLYLSDACRNDCAYCGFRRSHRRRRVHLSLAQALDEARVLSARGLRSIDLVTGEVPTDPFVDQVARAVEAILASTPIERVNLNLGALTREQYGRLRSAGAAAYHLYQETYDPGVYRSVHRDGPKRDLAWRLEAPERALDAGFEALGLGILLGLGEPARDLAALAQHARRLRTARPDLALGFSLPRLVSADAGCEFRGAHPIDDALLERGLLFLRTRFPDAQLALTTREPAALRDALLPLGITRLSAGVSTAPGGYTLGGVGPEQFRVGDGRTVEQVAAAVRDAGLEPVA